MLETKEVIKILVSQVKNKDLIISSLGRTAECIFSCNKNNQVLYLDCMGSVIGISIGVALACNNTDSTVYAFETDGSFMYDSTIVHTLAGEKNQLANLNVFILDNELFESGGAVGSRSSEFDWKLFFSAWNLDCEIIECHSELNKIYLQNKQRKLKIYIIKIKNNNLNQCLKDIDGIESRYRFKRFINDNIKKGIIKPCVKN